MGAPVTLVEYGDYECPHCRAAAPDIRQLLARMDGDLRFVARHLPLPDVHPGAALAAEAAEAAGAQGRFWEMHDALYLAAVPIGPAALDEIAASIGLDLDRFRQDLLSSRYARVVSSMSRRPSARASRARPRSSSMTSATAGDTTRGRSRRRCAPPSGRRACKGSPHQPDRHQGAGDGVSRGPSASAGLSTHPRAPSRATASCRRHADVMPSGRPSIGSSTVRRPSCRFEIGAGGETIASPGASRQGRGRCNSAIRKGSTPPGAPRALLIRPVRATDRRALEVLFAELDTTWFRPHDLGPAGARQVAGYMGRDVYLIGFLGSVPVAYGMLRGWDEGYRVPSLGIAIRMATGDRGLGRRMMEALHRAVRARGGERVRLRVAPGERPRPATVRRAGLSPGRHRAR